MTPVFRIPFDGQMLVGDVLTGEKPPRLLVLHGGGRSSRERFRVLREYLFTHGVGSVAFDCIGHGDTGAWALYSATAWGTCAIRDC